MRPFWHYAAMMRRYPATLAAAMAMALLSAGSLGAGLAGLKPVMELVLNGKDGADFPAVVAGWNEKLARYHVAVPSWVVLQTVSTHSRCRSTSRG